MRRWLVVALGFGLALGPVLAAFGAEDGDAASTVVSGWWSRFNQGAVNLSSSDPGATPEDGTSVASAPDGASAIAAIRFTLGDEEVNPVLTLKVTGSSTNADAADTIILACHAGAAWTAGPAQPWDSKPPAACDTATGGGSVTGQRSEDGTSWVFPLGVLQLNHVVNVVLVPGRAAAAPTSPTFQVSFARPAAGSIATDRGTPAPVPQPAAPSAASASAFPSAPVASPAPAFAPPPAPSTFVAALPASAQVITATAPVRREASPLATVALTRRVHTSGWVRLLAGLQVLAAALIAWLVLNGGSVDGDTRRGLGPFIRPRFGEAPRL